MVLMIEMVLSALTQKKSMLDHFRELTKTPEKLLPVLEDDKAIQEIVKNLERDVELLEKLFHLLQTNKGFDACMNKHILYAYGLLGKKENCDNDL